MERWPSTVVPERQDQDSTMNLTTAVAVPGRRVGPAALGLACSSPPTTMPPVLPAVDNETASQAFPPFSETGA
jgi:hypothetical protein